MYKSPSGAEKIRSMSSILTPRQFAIMQMRFVHKMKHARIGGVLNISERTVDFEVSDGFARLKEARHFVTDFDPESN